MTLAADRGVGRFVGHDRRGQAAEPRRSWASSVPFERRVTPYNAAEACADLWPRVAGAYRRRVVVLDALAASGVGLAVLSGLLGFGLEALALAAAGTVGLVMLVWLGRGYEQRNLGDGAGEYQSLLRAGVGVGVLLVIISYTYKVEISRALVFGGVPLLVLVSIAGRYLHRRFLHRAREKGAAMMHTLVVGAPADVPRVIRDLSAAPYHGYRVTGVCLPSLDTAVPELEVPVVGAVADVPQIVVDRAVDVVVVVGSCMSGEGLRRLSWALDRAGAQLTVAPDLVEVGAPRLTLRPTAGLSLLEVEVGAPRNRMLAKAVLDRALGAALLALAAPVVGLLAVAVRLTSPGPAFYRQTRVGVDGRTFTLWKLRSMYVDADRRLTELRDRNDGAGVLFKMREDPRVTRIGRLLRRFSLDELPQLLNVVTGDMSLVGPRPPLVNEVEQYPDAAHRRLRVKPGLTGLWQISGRSDLSWEDSVRLDLRYVDNWSVTMDLVILWKTLRAVVLGVGAY